MAQDDTLTALYGELELLAPEGYAVGLHIAFAKPKIYMSKYPPDWVAFYNAHSYFLRDPMVFWCIGTTGTTRWSAIPLPDPFGIMRKAATYGMKYGAVCSFGPLTARSMSGICRSDREFDDAELARLTELTERLHHVAALASPLSGAQIEALLCIAKGDHHSTAAVKLGITEDEFSQRLESARLVLKASSISQAVEKARPYFPSQL